jgi:hypothetical protein
MKGLDVPTLAVPAPCWTVIRRTLTTRAGIVLTATTLLTPFLRTPLSPRATDSPRAETFDVRGFHAVGDGIALDTQAIANAIQAAAHAGGGTVHFPAGTYRSGTFELLSNVTLDLDAGATIRGSTDLADYGSTEAYGFGHEYGVNSTGEGSKVGIIVARHAENIAIVGHGTIDGQADSFFDSNVPHYSMDFDPARTRQGQLFLDAVRQTGDGPIEFKSPGRPGTLMVFSNCRNVLLRDVTIRSAPNWTVHFANTSQVVVSGVHIVNSELLPNNDGIDCMGCKNVHVSACDIQAGDDDLAIVNSEDITVADCSLVSRSSAIRLESTRHAIFSELNIDSNRGIGVYGRGGGKTSDVLFSSVTIRTRLFTGHWWGKAEPVYIAASAPTTASSQGEISGIRFSNIIATAESGILIYGAPGALVRNVSFDQIHLTLRRTRPQVSDAVGGNFDLRWTARTPANAVFKHDIPGCYCRYADGLRLQNVTVAWGTQKAGFYTHAIECEDFRNLTIDRFKGRQAFENSQTAVISLARGDGVTVRDSTADPGTLAFVSATEIRGHNLFVGNDLSHASRAFGRGETYFTVTGNYGPFPTRASPNKK